MFNNKKIDIFSDGQKKVLQDHIDSKKFYVDRKMYIDVSDFHLMDIPDNPEILENPKDDNGGWLKGMHKGTSRANGYHCNHDTQDFNDLDKGFGPKDY